MDIQNALWKLHALADATTLDASHRDAVKLAADVLNNVRNLMGLGSGEDLTFIPKAVHDLVNQLSADNPKVLQPPVLERDQMMLSEHGQEISTDGRLERRIAWNLLKHLEASGWIVVAVNDGEENTELKGDKNPAKAAMELLFNLDEASLMFSKQGTDYKHYVQILLGNTFEMVNDWGFVQGDPDGFNAAMNEFKAEAYA